MTLLKETKKWKKHKEGGIFLKHYLPFVEKTLHSHSLEKVERRVASYLPPSLLECFLNYQFASKINKILYINVNTCKYDH